ncbi:hypothetical protein OG331_23020 [Streptomyces sp. NBC_01017]|uniref:hypothetical protein n=1 Tax=Streptomyces sp. NBC_01017 TaxID=2903721 RepID=UPI0038642BFA|nr:hypothetical protein OG331_23020 [Streptomyces sp. NBC_01017]
MRIHVAAAAIAALTLTGCGAVQPIASVGQSPTQPQVDAPRVGSADLIRPGVTKAEAQDAIRDHAAGLNGYELYYLKVMRSTDAHRYVCRARWYADPDAYLTHSGNTEAWPDSWPHVAINCP